MTVEDDPSEDRPEARPGREVTSATFSYVDAMLSGRMSDLDLARVRAEILGEEESPAVEGPTPAAAPPWLSEIRAHLGRGELTQALTLAESALARDASCALTLALAEECRALLAERYQGHLGQGWYAPRLLAPLAPHGEGIDPWFAFVASRIDGQSSIDELVDLVGLSRLDTLRVLYELRQRGHIVVEERDAPPQRPVALARIKLKRRR